MTSVALKAKIRKICREVKRVMNVRWRLIGSVAVWFWLARIIRGSSQQVSTRRGIDRRSVAMYGLRDAQPVSDKFASHVRLMNAMTRLWVRVMGHNHFEGVHHVTGTSISVGMRIFSIEGG